ncbi:hypothetical protein [Pseudovibrio exalbescens]|uniref:Uncharacterized protein n=1 Tax=Pseudovibrio exalbescens TaxID=197461 RepID=A0A1U7JGR3_9HYPH|nr:hypothetical protein [Pseudovibrio exalbescens]OKL43936.1 hypothetical protein A3843_10075 [Pseudovibrio exalbescens]
MAGTHEEMLDSIRCASAIRLRTSKGYTNLEKVVTCIALNRVFLLQENQTRGDGFGALQENQLAILFVDRDPVIISTRQPKDFDRLAPVLACACTPSPTIAKAPLQANCVLEVTFSTSH